MTITKPKRKIATKTEVVEQFIEQAPDAVPHKKGIKKGNKEQISLTITPELLAQVDALAEQLGQSRAAVINMALYQMVNSGLSVSGLKATQS